MMNKRANDQTIKEAIQLLLETYKIKDKFMETEIEANWPSIVGPVIANRTMEVYIRHKKLYLKLNSAVLKHELMMSKQKMIDLINDKSGSDVVNDVVFM